MRIGFTGDVAVCGFFNTDNTLNQFIDTRVIEALYLNDYNVINLEGACPSLPVHKKGGLKQADSALCGELLKKYKLEVCFLANNHICDCGYQGLLDTIRFCKQKGFLFFGAGEEFSEAIRPIILEKDGITVGLIGAGHEDGVIASPNKTIGGIMCSSREESKFFSAIRHLKSQVDYCVVVYHGGYEFYKHPCEQDRNRYMSFIDNGADIVIVHHPHVVRGYEVVNGKYIVYSLGNFIFDTPYQRRNRGTEEGILLNVNFVKDAISIEPIFTILNRDTMTINTVAHNDNYALLKPEEIDSLFVHDVYESVCLERKNKKYGLIKQCIKALIRRGERKKYLIALKYAVKRNNR